MASDFIPDYVRKSQAKLDKARAKQKELAQTPKTVARHK
jgi:hypothetical protein